MFVLQTLMFSSIFGFQGTILAENAEAFSARQSLFCNRFRGIRKPSACFITGILRMPPPSFPFASSEKQAFRPARPSNPAAALQ